MTDGHFDSIFRCLALLAPIAYAIWPFRKSAGPDTENPTADSPEEQSVEAVIDHLDWGIRLGMLGKFERAAERFQQAAQADPEDASALYNLALALDQAGDHARAVEVYKRAIEIEPDFADAHTNLAIALLETGDREAAAEWLRRAAEIDTGDALPHFNRGCLHVAQEEWQTAVTEFQEAATIDPKDAQTRFNLAIALSRTGRTDDCERELRDFLALARGRYREQSQYATKLLGESSIGG